MKTINWRLRAIIRRFRAIDWGLRAIIRRLGAIDWRLRGSIIGIAGNLFIDYCASELATATCNQTDRNYDQQDCPPLHLGSLALDSRKKS